MKEKIKNIAESILAILLVCLLIKVLFLIKIH
jgi:hypothetical protein